MNPTVAQFENLNGANLVFIVGCPRSGTTWLQRLLATHPQIKTGQESRLFEYVGTPLRLWQRDLAKADGRGGTGMAGYLNTEEFFSIQKNYLAALLAPMLKELSPGQIFLEKTPGHALFIPEIVQLLPAAKIIHLLRDPRDVVASLLAASKSWGKDWAPRRAKHAARLWCEHTRRAQAAGKLLPPGQFLEVSYEALLANPTRGLVAITRFLNLPWSDVEIFRAIAANSADEMRQGKGTPIPLHGELGKQSSGRVQDPKEFVRKARPGSWREDLTLLERWQVWCVLRKNSRQPPGGKK
jgi:hypothetical protein